jgi:hypothetical protein
MAAKYSRTLRFKGMSKYGKKGGNKDNYWHYDINSGKPINPVQQLFELRPIRLFSFFSMRVSPIMAGLHLVCVGFTSES